MEAGKCYLNALRLDKENQQILRDLAMIQMQTRDTSALTETRQQMLSLRPGVRANWIGFSIAHHLAGHHDVAVQILEAHEATLEEVPASEVYEHSEMLLYKATILKEAGKEQDALDLIHKRKASTGEGQGFERASFHPGPGSGTGFGLRFGSGTTTSDGAVGFVLLVMGCVTIGG